MTSIRRPVPAAIALVLALAAGACSRGDRSAGAGAGGLSDTLAYRAATALGDTAKQVAALDAFLGKYPESSFRARANRRLYNLERERDPAAAAARVRKQLKQEKQAEARGALHYALFEHVHEHAPGEQAAVARDVLADRAALDYDVYNAVAWDLADSGQELDLALELAARGLASAPDSLSKAACLDTQGWIHYQKGDHAKAIAALEAGKAVSNEPFEELDIHLAKAYQAGGMKEKARDLFLELMLTQEDPDLRARLTQVSQDLGGSPAEVFRDLDRRREERATPAADFGLKDYSGKDVHLADFRGSIVLLNFWHPT